MSVVSTDLVFYGSANMPENDTDPAGGAIDTAVRVIPNSATLMNAPGGLIEMVSSNAADTMNVTVTGRNAAGSIVSETKALDGTTAVDFVATFERILKIVLASAAAGTVTIRQDGGGTTIVAVEAGVTTIRRPFYAVGADVAGGAARVFYEKIFLKNNNGTNSLLGAQITEDADPETQLEFALEDAVNDNESTANRLAAPVGITGDAFSSAAKNVPGTDLAAGAAIGVWLKLSLPAGDPATKTSYTLEASGTTT